MDKEYILTDASVLQWVRSSLEDPLALSLSKLALAQMNLRFDSATFTVLACSHVSGQDLLDFKHGGKISRSYSADRWLHCYLKSRYSGKNITVIAEDWQLNPESKVIEKYNYDVLYYEREVYFFCHLDQGDSVEPGLGLCAQNLVPLFHGFVLDDICLPNKQSFLEKEDLLKIAQRLKAIYFGIYDGESWLVCTFD